MIATLGAGEEEEQVGTEGGGGGEARQGDSNRGNNITPPLPMKTIGENCI